MRLEGYVYQLPQWINNSQVVDEMYLIRHPGATVDHIFHTCDTMLPRLYLKLCVILLSENDGGSLRSYIKQLIFMNTYGCATPYYPGR